VASWTEAVKDARVAIFAVALIWLIVALGKWFATAMI
jgi:hypothetical protein